MQGCQGDAINIQAYVSGFVKREKVKRVGTKALNGLSGKIMEHEIKNKAG